MFTSEFVGGRGEGKETKSWLQWRERERERENALGRRRVLKCDMVYRKQMDPQNVRATFTQRLGFPQHSVIDIPSHFLLVSWNL